MALRICTTALIPLAAVLGVAALVTLTAYAPPRR